jgi:hypothetical protein
MTQPQPQQQNQRPQQKPQVQQQSLNAKGNNLYAVAYKTLWDQLPGWRQSEITEMIAAKDFDNRHYTDFIQAVITLAEES